MLSGIQRTLTLLFLITLGFALKRAGFLGDAERKTISKLYINVTFPMVIISSFAPFAGEPELIMLALMGFLFSCIMMGIAILAARNRSREDRAFAAINCSAMSLGAFATSFLQGFLPSEQLVLVLLYDTGNGIMAFGGTDMAGKMILDWGNPGTLKNGLKKLARSVSVWTYVLMLGLGLLHLHLPEVLYNAAGFIGNANPILAMLLIGCTLDFSSSSGTLVWIGKLLVVHYSTVAVLALLVYFLLPLPQITRAIIVLLLFSPLGSAGLAVTDSYNLDRNAAGLLNSITVLIGVAAILFLPSVVGLN